MPVNPGMEPEPGNWRTKYSWQARDTCKYLPCLRKTEQTRKVYKGSVRQADAGQ